MSTDSRSATRDPLLCLMITGVLTTALLFATVLPICAAPSDGGPDVHRHSWTGAMPDSAGDGSTPSAGSPPSWPAGPVPAGGSAQGGGLVSGRPSPPDASGVYVAGTVEGAFPGQTSLGSGDAFVARFDAEGNLMWVRQFGSEAAEGASAISLSASGVYVAGNTGVTKKWLDEFNYTYIGRNDAFLRKFDRSGDTVWTREITSLGIDWIDCATGVANDATGVYVAGMTDGTLSSPEPQQGLRPDAFVRKYDADGNELWTRQFGSVTHAQDAAYGVAADGTGVYVAGRTQGVYTGETAYGNSDGF